MHRVALFVLPRLEARSHFLHGFFGGLIWKWRESSPWNQCGLAGLATNDRKYFSHFNHAQFIFEFPHLYCFVNKQYSKWCIKSVPLGHWHDDCVLLNPTWASFLINKLLFLWETISDIKRMGNRWEYFPFLQGYGSK